jgi:hypothetical protein
VEDVTLEAGAQSVALVEEPIAAAIGSGLRVEDARGSMIVDIGGGTTEVAVMSLGGIVQPNSLRIAGDELDEAIVSYIKRKYNILIGESTAEVLKKRIGSVHPATDRGSMQIRGRNLLNGLPATMTISSAEIREAMQDEVQHIVESIIHHSRHIDQLHKPSLFPQVFLLICRNVPPRFNIPEQRCPTVMEHAEINDLVGFCPVEKFRSGFCVLNAPALSGDTGHHMGIEDHANLLYPGYLGVGLLQIVILLHKGQHIVQARFNA